jgi:uncharacterized integral membrane protein (TIGR00698 family)
MHDSLTGPGSSHRLISAARDLAPGIALSVAVGLAAASLEPLVRSILPLPVMVIALAIGVGLNGLLSRGTFEAGIAWCVKRLLRVAIALLGLRIAFGDIIDLGLATGTLIVAAMSLTLVAGVWLARVLDLNTGYGALAGAATAVCGASATLATATVVPSYPQKSADVAFTVVAANTVSTLVMLAYPPLCVALGLDPRTTGVVLGGAIHDMAQVVGAGYGVSEPVGNSAVIVKLFRVFLLLPVVLAIGWWFTRKGADHDRAKVPLPVFALVFLGLSVVNSVVPAVPALAAIYAPLKDLLVTASNWGLLVAIAALGLGTSPAAILRIGWRHILLFIGTTAVILVVVGAGALVLA